MATRFALFVLIFCRVLRRCDRRAAADDCHRADCVFVVDDSSMEPDFPNDCMVLVKSNSDSGEPPLGDIGASVRLKKFLKKDLHFGCYLCLL